MSEPDAEPSAPVPAPFRRCCNWHRVRLYIWATLLALSLWGFGAAFTLRHQPKRLVEDALATFPFPSSVADVRWTGPDTLVIHDLKLGDFFYAYSVVVTLKLHDLVRQHITAITLNGPELFMSKLDRAMANNPKGKKGNGLGWTITKLTINRGTVMIDAGPGMPSLPVRVGARRPVIVNYLKLMKPDDSKVMTEEHVVDLEDIFFSSPFDPLAPVLSLPLVRVRFTYKEIWHHQIREIDLIRPNLFLGQDLFWFTDQFKKDRATATKAGPEAPWQVGQFEVRYGQLTVNVFGQPRLHFPFFFDTTVSNIRLDQLDKITAKNAIVIRDFSQDYPDYKIKIVNLHGRIEFSVPPTSATANNVVPTLSIDEVSWNGIAATKVWCSATFDPTGIYVKLGGDCEKGLMNGNFEVSYTNGFAWNADFFARQIDCQPIFEKLAGKYGSLTGQLDGKISVVGHATDILKCAGTLSLDRPGLLKIQSVDNLIQRIPADMTSMKRDAMKLALQAFAVYPYTTGELKLDYAPGDGVATLKLDGAYGKRDFSVYWHPFGASEVANGTDTH
jgi:hypothetical protein